MLGGVDRALSLPLRLPVPAAAAGLPHRNHSRGFPHLENLKRRHRAGRRRRFCRRLRSIPRRSVFNEVSPRPQEALARAQAIVDAFAKVRAAAWSDRR